MPDVIARAPSRRFELPAAWSVDVGEYVTGLAWSPDGARVVACTAEGRVTALDARDGGAAWSALPHPGGALRVACSPAGGRVASAGQDGRAMLLDGATGTPVATLPSGGRAWVEHAQWSPTGGALATASQGVVRFWNADGSPLLETPPHASAVAAISWRRDGRELAVACYGGVSVWSLDAVGMTRRFEWKGSLISAAWSPDGEVIACGSQDCTVHFWRVRSGRDSEMSGYPLKPRALAWDARSTLLATSGAVDITVWRFEAKGPEGSAPLELQGHQAPVSELAFHPRKAVLASGGGDASVLLWEPRRGRKPLRYAFARDVVSQVAWSPDGASLAAGDASGHVTCWRVADVGAP